MTTGMNAIICRSVSRSRNAASWTTKTSHSKSPKAAGLSRVHFFQSCFHMGVPASLREPALYHSKEDGRQAAPFTQRSNSVTILFEAPASSETQERHQRPNGNAHAHFHRRRATLVCRTETEGHDCGQSRHRCYHLGAT